MPINEGAAHARLVSPVKQSREFVAPVAPMASLDNFAGITRGDANAIDS
jgi:hypothetical protein